MASESVLRETVMSTMEPEVMDGGRRMEGNSIWARLRQYTSALLALLGASVGLTRRLSSVRRTATPASTLPTVSEISMLSVIELRSSWLRV